MEDGEYIELSDQDFGLFNKDRLNRYFSGMYGNRLIIRNFDLPRGFTGDDFINTITEKYSEYVLGFKHLAKVTEFFRKVVPCVCLINPDTKSSVLYVAHCGISARHYLQSGIPAYLPWFFDPEAGLEEDEMNLIKSLGEKDSGKYIECVNKIGAKYDFDISYLNSKLDKFEVAADKHMLTRLSNEFSECVSDIDAYMGRLHDAINRRDGINIRMMGIRQKIENNDNNEILDYFIANRNRLTLVDTRKQEGIITFTIRDYLTWWDEDFVENALNNEESYFYNPEYNDGKIKFSKQDARMLFKAIFIDREIRVRMCASYTLKLSGRVVANSGNSTSYYDYECDGYIRNPHVFYYSCLGGYEAAIAQYLTSGNYIGAIEQCLASTRSVNVSESATCEKFLSEIYGFRASSGNSSKFLELPDGSLVTTIEAIEWLRAKGE